MKKTDSTQVRFVDIDADAAQQRIDNFLRTQLKGVPKSLIYRIIRKGEVRVNKKRIKPEYKLKAGDQIRIPPVRVSEPTELPNAKLNKVASLEQHILYEDNQIIVFNKPSGLAVHGGSGLSFGLIEGLRALRPESRFLELVHRLDKDTSGIIVVAKKRSALTALHEQLREKTADKRYLAFVRGHWPETRHKVKAPLHKNVLKSGERIVNVSEQGKPSETRYFVKQYYQQGSLVVASPLTGRTHQIRVHCLHAGHPIAGDPKYGDADFDQQTKTFGLERLFLHAWKLTFVHPKTGQQVSFEAPLENRLERFLKQLEKT